MTVREIKTLPHININENEHGTIIINTEDGYYLVNEEEQITTTPEGEETKELVKNFASVIYTRNDAKLFDYQIATADEKEQYDKEFEERLTNQINL